MQRLSFEEFEKQIKRLQAASEYKDEIRAAHATLESAGICTDFLGEASPSFEDDVVKLLEKMFDDEDGWISYFCWELDFGKLWEDGMISDSEHSSIPLKTVKDLWNNFLCKEDPVKCKESSPKGMCGPQCEHYAACGMCSKFGSLKPVISGTKCPDYKNKK